MTLRLELWVEGPTDAVIRRRKNQPDDEAGEVGGALAPLVRKALERTDGLTPQALAAALPEREVHACTLQSRTRDVVRLDNISRQRQLSTKGWKALAAIMRARRRAPETLIVAVWDRDGKVEPLRDREIILEALREMGGGAAVGICIEEIEAWLLADPSAFRGAFRRGPRSGIPGNPEDETDPKEVLNTILADYPDTADRPATFRRLAECVDLETLTRRCPRGFGRLCDALQELIAPHLRNAPP
jgi:hypothetical protein